MITNNQIEMYFEKLLRIMAGKGNARESKEVQLRNLAKEVGASSEMFQASPANAGEPELVDNIIKSLQTASMILVCKTSTKNYKIALIATVIALGSALALWITVLCK
jgi:hypothetical protein